MASIYDSQITYACRMNTSLADESSNPKTLSLFNGAAVSSAQSYEGGLSLLLNGTNQYASTPAVSDFLIGNGDFTIEAWIYPTNTTGGKIAGIWSDTSGFGFSWKLSATSTGISILTSTTGANDYTYSSAATIPANAWTHVAASRKSGTLYLFVNGAIVGTHTCTEAFYAVASSKFFEIGRDGAGPAQYFAGYIDCVRLTKACRYDSDFTASVVAYPNVGYKIAGTVKDANGNFAQRIVRAHRRSNGQLIGEVLSNPSTGEFSVDSSYQDKHYAVVHDSDAWITYLAFNGDNNSTIFPEWSGKSVAPYGNAKISTAQSKFGGASLYLDGVEDALTVSYSNNFYFGPLDFTVEFWVRPETTVAASDIVSNRNSNGVDNWLVRLNAGGAIRVVSTLNSVAITDIVTSATVQTSVWTHVAIVRISGTVRVYLNGTEESTTGLNPTTPWPDVIAPLWIGVSHGLLATPYKGYIDDLRISKGKAQYVGNFTPATVPHFTEQAGDPYWNNVVLAMHMDGQPDNGDPYRNDVVLNMRMNGTNGSTTIVEDTGKAVTVYGNAQLSTAQKKYGTASLALDGSGDYLALDGSATLACGTGGFTIEVWVRPISFAQNGVIFDFRPFNTNGAYPCLVVNTSGNLLFYVNTATELTSTTALSINTWHHIAVVKSSGTTRIYIDGVSASTTFTDGNNYAVGASRPIIGASGFDLLASFNGYIDDLRVTKGVARYTTDFTPPAAELPALQRAFPDVKSGKVVTANGDVVISSAQSKFGGFSAYFDGSGDYLSIPSSSDFDFGANDFTIEGWVYRTAAGTNDMVIYTGNTSGALNIRFGANNKLAIVRSAIAVLLESTSTVGTGAWTHFAVCRLGNAHMIFLNGVLEATTSSYTGSHTQGSPVIGMENNNYYFTGYIDDLRITKGLARYTTNFIPPDAPFPEQLQTYGQQNAMIYDHLTPV